MNFSLINVVTKILNISSSGMRGIFCYSLIFVCLLSEKIKSILDITECVILLNSSSPFDMPLFRHFEAIEARFLRASFSAFVDVLTLATKTIEEFGQGMEL